MMALHDIATLQYHRSWAVELVTTNIGAYRYVDIDNTAFNPIHNKSTE